MRVLLAGMLIMSCLVQPLRAETPGHLLTEAAGIARGITSLNDRRRALEAVIETYALRGDLAAVLCAPGGPGVMLTHDNVWSGVATLHWLWGIRPGDGLIEQSRRSWRAR